MFDSKIHSTKAKLFLQSLTLLTLSTKAEESSILEGARVINAEDFNSHSLPDQDMFLGPGFKNRMLTNNSAGHLGNYSKEVIIQLAEAHKVITVFFNGRVDATDDKNRRSDGTSVWVGDDAGDFSSDFTKVIEAIYGSGFNHVADPISAQFLNLRIYRTSNLDTTWNG